MTSGNYPPGGTWEIDTGWDVVTADGEKLGGVEEVHPHYLVIGKGWLFRSERYVPVSTITDVADNTVYLGVTKAEAESQDWDRIPDVTGTTPGYADTSYTETDDVVDTTRYADRDMDRMDRTRRTTSTDDITVPVVEEELEVRKRQVDEGTVRVHKDVVETEKQVSVPVREERIRVERTPAGDRDAVDAGEHVFDGEDIEIPLRSEEVEVSKRPVVRENVRISKDVVEREEQAGGTVRREQVYVEGEDVTDHTDRP